MEYKGFHINYPKDLSPQEWMHLPLRVTVWDKLLGGYIVLAFAEHQKGELELKKEFPEAAGIIHAAVGVVHCQGIKAYKQTLVIIFEEDMKE